MDFFHKKSFGWVAVDDSFVIKWRKFTQTNCCVIHMVLCCSGSLISIFFFCRRKEVFAEKSHLTLKNHIFPKISQNSKKLSPWLAWSSRFPLYWIHKSSSSYRYMGANLYHTGCNNICVRHYSWKKTPMLAVFLILFSKKDRAGKWPGISSLLHQLFSKIIELVGESTLRHLFLVKPSTCSKHLKKPGTGGCNKIKELPSTQHSKIPCSSRCYYPPLDNLTSSLRWGQVIQEYGCGLSWLPHCTLVYLLNQIN
jgi:hypothetical protein